jgi:hypothetical protein
MDEKAGMKELEVAAAYVLSQTSLAQRVPEDARREIDEVLRRPPSQRSSAVDVWRDLRIKERFGVGAHTFREYARQLWATDRREVCGPVVLGLAALLSVPMERGVDLAEREKVLVQARLAEVLRREDLPPEQLVKLVEAVAKRQAIAVKEAEQKLAQKESQTAEEAARQRAKTRGDDLTVEERVRRIYGFDAPKAKDAGEATQ